jgi:hypothetical protein
MGNADSSPDDASEIRSEIVKVSAADGSCQHINSAISVLLMERVVPSRNLINKAQCICYYCNPLSRNVFTRGAKKDVIPNSCVKIAFNYLLRDAKESAQGVINTFRRVYHGADVTTMSHILSARRFYPRNTKFSRNSRAEEDTSSRPYERLNFHTGLLEMYNPSQVFMTPEPELAFKWGQNDGNFVVMLQVLFDPEFVFSKGQDTTLDEAEGAVRRGCVSKDLRQAEKQANEFRSRPSTYHCFPDSEVEYYINSDKLFEQQEMSPSFYINAIYFRFTGKQ